VNRVLSKEFVQVVIVVVFECGEDGEGMRMGMRREVY